MRTLLVASLLTLLAAPALSTPVAAQGDAMVRVVHASPDAPAVDVYVDGDAAFTNLSFPDATDYATLPAGTYDIQVFASSADGEGDPAIDASGLALAAGPVTIVAVGQLADIEPLILEDNLAAPAAGMTHVRFVHASPDAPAVDITTADGTAIFSNISFKGDTGFTPIDSGTYDLQARVAGTDTVALDLPGVELPDGAIVTVFATGLLEGEPGLSAEIVTYPVQEMEMTDEHADEMPEQMPKTGAGATMPLMLALAGMLLAGSGLALRRRAVQL